MRSCIITLTFFWRNSGATTIKVLRGGTIHNFEVDSPSVDIASRRTSNNDVPGGDELCTATLLWFQENKPEMVRAKLVVTFEAKGWVVLFTPPYCPDLQPIELFWATGKNRARSFLDARALEESRNRSMEETVNDLRDGWYGNGSTVEPCNCAGLVLTALKKANERVAFDEFLSGTVQNLTVDPCCQLALGTDNIGRATRALCRRAAESGLIDSEVTASGICALGDVDIDSDDDDGDDSDEEAGV